MCASDPPAFPFTSANPLEPPAEYAALRRDQPVSRVCSPTGQRIWLVTRYADVRLVLSDSRFSRQAITKPDAPRFLPIAQDPRSISVMDPPGHHRVRGLVSRAFTPRRVESLRARIQSLASSLVDDMIADASPADLMGGLARPLPMAVICRMLGVP